MSPKKGVPAAAAAAGTLPPPPQGYCIVESVTTTGGKKTLLQSMQLDFPANSVTAILGPSGSGKTTLLSVLTDSVATNVTAKANVQMTRCGAAFVPQDDRLHGFYTVRGYMQHYARLTGIAGKPDTAGRIDKLLKQLGLTEQAGTIVGDLFLKGLSGGQKRRLSIALEALTQPQTFYLDEPTSGLDSESARQVMEFLSSYVRESAGRRVILTIHQPSSFIWSTIENVILLSKGQLMYNGSRSEMEDFFAGTGYPTPVGWNPADHYVTVVNDEFRDHALSVNQWALEFTSFHNSNESRQARSGTTTIAGTAASSSSSAPIVETKRSGSFLVSFELTYRYFLNLAFNPGILGTRIAMYTMLAGMVGALFWGLGDRTDFESVQSRIAVAFYCVAFFIFMSVAVLPFTVMERSIVDKEVQNRYYHPVMYQISQALASIPGTAILAFIVTLLIITMTGMKDPLWYFLNMFLSLIVAEALAQLISHIVPHFVIGMALLAGLYGFFMLFQGFMLVPSDFPDWLAWLYPVAFHTYAWRTFMVTEFRGNETFTGGQFATGEDVLVFYEIEDVNRTYDMLTLVGYAAVVHCLSFLVLHLRHTLFRGKIEPISRSLVKQRAAVEVAPRAAVVKSPPQPTKKKTASVTSLVSI